MNAFATEIVGIYVNVLWNIAQVFLLAMCLMKLTDLCEIGQEWREWRDQYYGPKDEPPPPLPTWRRDMGEHD